ncbi:MAG: hypothetical protein Q7K43_01775, partial [Candidatus Woesearchaeota archaeon]|nr:hypothetical protein [Candidatus Woesearchaeota archaeon]
MSWRNYWDKVKRYAVPSKKESREFLILIAVFAFIASFNQWGDTEFSVVQGLTNYLATFVIAGISVLVHHVAQRLMAVHYGFRPVHEVWWTGLLLGVVLVFITQGKVQIFAASGIGISMLYQHRLGTSTTRYGPGIHQHATIALTGLVANVLFAGVAKTIELWTGITLPALHNLFIFNLWYAGLNLIPIPPLDGSRIFYASRLLYVFLVVALIAYSGFAIFLNIYSYI